MRHAMHPMTEAGALAARYAEGISTGAGSSAA